MWAQHDECKAAGVDIRKIESIARRISKAGKEAAAMGVNIFGGSGTGSLRFDDRSGKGSLILAGLDGIFDGGDGAVMLDDTDLERGEV